MDEMSPVFQQLTRAMPLFRCPRCRKPLGKDCIIEAQERPEGLSVQAVCQECKQTYLGIGIIASVQVPEPFLVNSTELGKGTHLYNVHLSPSIATPSDETFINGDIAVNLLLEEMSPEQVDRFNTLTSEQKLEELTRSLPMRIVSQLAKLALTPPLTDLLPTHIRSQLREDRMQLLWTVRRLVDSAIAYTEEHNRIHKLNPAGSDPESNGQPSQTPSGKELPPAEKGKPE
ncbi:MAG: hypothetical protein ACUVX1_12795 [Chloroflexota bacterium]